MTVAVRIAGEENLQALSRKLLRLIEDKESQVYQDNVAKFGIPDDYVKKAFSEETLLKASKTQNARFYLAVEDDEITGFAQFVRQDDDTAELDRILIFPGRIGKGIGTELLHQALADQREKGVKMVIVNAGREETQARRFYEKNGFTQAHETTIDAPWGKKVTLVTYHLFLR